MNNKKLQEFKDDAAADKAVAAVTSALTKLASVTTNKKDYARVIEAIAKWLKSKKGTTLSTLDSDPKFKMILKYLDQIESDTQNTSVPSTNSVAQKP